MLSYLYEPILDYQYDENDLKPIMLDFSPQCKKEILNAYFNKGFAIYEIINNNKEIKLFLEELASFFNLGQPYKPPIYDNTNLYKDGINKLNISEGAHVAFQTNKAQDLHCDGTLEEIGLIKTSLLHCVRPAANGGENIIFNSIGAFHNLYKIGGNRKALESLLKPNALKRCAINVTGAEYVGPVFKMTNEKLISRFSKDNTSCWKESFVKDDSIKKAYDLINKLILDESTYSIKFKLEKNQGIIIANDRVAHGRTAFYDNKRKLYRGLYKEILR
ncbi:TauD/TfdA family dioxygenase [Kurthia populi]|uniref:TauD/TfdA family dioxygenase n=1 Tax=Kurthia populi TaxID=1562132 RepID=A0ABW5XYQ9_9BACL